MEDGENKNKFKTIIFKDSFLLLPLSLRELAKAFKLDNIKGYFPFYFARSQTDIFYQGVFPPFEFFYRYLTKYLSGIRLRLLPPSGSGSGSAHARHS
jgi:DNA polymerase type B, organellar and viral